MNIYLWIILGIVIGEYLLSLIVENLNLSCASGVLPQEFVGYYDSEKYRQSQNYLKESTRFKLFKNTLFTLITVIFILIGGFNFVDKLARGVGLNYILTGLIFAGILLLATQLMDIPFSIYHTFGIEERYGFNRTSVKTFVLDILKSLTLSAVIGGIIFSVIIWFFARAGAWAWFYCWMGVALFQLFLLFIAPVVILPLFNKFVPLEDCELKKEIEQYADSENFKIKGIFKMDGSRRSSKSNAFFTGFGKFRRIALFDTLIAKHKVSELVSVLAHEIGHYKKRHIIKNLAFSTFASGIMFFILSLFINNKELFVAFKMDEVSIYASLFFFGFLYSPISLIFSIFSNLLSRRYEYVADAYAVSTYKKPQAMIEALKKLTVDNLGNLSPHPFKVFLHYSHPPVLKRIHAIKRTIRKE